MMRTPLTILTASAVLALVACSPSTPDPVSVELPAASTTVNTTSTQGTSVPCINGGKINISSLYELSSPFREKMLTPEALQKGIKVFTSGWSENQYGSVTLTYWDSTGRCFLWAETLTLQEYSVRLGMSPLGISPHYESSTEDSKGDN